MMHVVSQKVLQISIFLKHLININDAPAIQFTVK